MDISGAGEDCQLLNVSYNRPATEMSGGQNNSRLTSMTYPNGRVLDYNYNSGLDITISRLS